MKKDVFISHASEDKETIAIPFTKELEKYGISYWLDMKELAPGDQLSDKIFKDGIAKSDYLVVKKKKKFLVKGWATAELRNAMAKQLRTNTKIVIPFLVDIKFSDLLEIYPEFENIFCGDLKNGIDDAALQLSKIVNSQVISITALFRRYEFLSILNWHKDELLEKLNQLSYDSLFATYTPQLAELMYSYIFANFTEQQQKQFLSDRLNMEQTEPLESFFQISLAMNSNWPDKNNIMKKILKQYPAPQPQDFLSATLPHKEISFFQKIDAGAFTFGAENSDNYRKDWIARPVNTYLNEYSISAVPVTNKLYELFSPEHIAKRLMLGEDTSHHPVVNVNWYEATMFAIWLTQLMETVSLPTEFEWEKAASWSEKGEKSIFPWGNRWKKNYCNSWYDGSKKGTTRVGLFEKGKSSYGLYDMSGNVWEWCSDWFSDDWPKYFSENITSNPSGPMIGNRKVDRGGGWYKDVGMPTVYMRAGDSLMDRFTHCGFRIVKRSKRS
jgi:formylglycine-generating enzyme required for sulfatase activity